MWMGRVKTAQVLANLGYAGVEQVFPKLIPGTGNGVLGWTVQFQSSHCNSVLCLHPSVWELASFTDYVQKKLLGFSN